MARTTCCPNPLRIPHPKIDKLACQAQGVGILAIGEITLHMKSFSTACIILMELDKLACQAQGEDILAVGEISLFDAYCNIFKS